MKGATTLIAALAATSAVALSSSTSALLAFTSNHQEKSMKPGVRSEKGEFAPKFDGLRFIETLVTAHR